MEKSILNGLTKEQIAYLDKIKISFETENWMREEENRRIKLSTSERFYKITCITDGGKHFGRDIGFVAKARVSPDDFNLECVLVEGYLFDDFYRDIKDKISEGGLYEDYDSVSWGNDYDYAGDMRENGARLIVEQKEISEREYKNSKKWKKPTKKQINLIGN